MNKPSKIYLDQARMRYSKKVKKEFKEGKLKEILKWK